jgi:hypothetical protein
VYSITYAVNLINQVKKEKVYENIYRSTHTRYIDVCYSTYRLGYQNRRFIMDYRAYCTDESEEKWSASQDAIHDRTQQLMSESYEHDDCDFYNISDHLFSATVEEAKSITEYARNKDFEKLGRLIWSISYRFCQFFAEQQALDEYHNGELDE